MRTSLRRVAIFIVLISIITPFVTAYSWDTEDVEVDNSHLLTPNYRFSIFDINSRNLKVMMLIFTST